MPSGGFFVIMIYYNATGHPLQKVIINSQDITLQLANFTRGDGPDFLVIASLAKCLTNAEAPPFRLRCNLGYRSVLFSVIHQSESNSVIKTTRAQDDRINAFDLPNVSPDNVQFIVVFILPQQLNHN